jgi:hypothetical protein
MNAGGPGSNPGAPTVYLPRVAIRVSSVLKNVAAYISTFSQKDPIASAYLQDHPARNV